MASSPLVDHAGSCMEHMQEATMTSGGWRWHRPIGHVIVAELILSSFFKINSKF